VEARQAIKGTSVPKGLIAIMAVGATIGLATIASIAAKDLGSPTVTQQTSAAHPAAGTVLRQDNPVQPALSSAQAVKHSGRSAGNQSVDGAALTDGTAGGPESDLTRALPQGVGLFDARSVREGHGV